MQRNPFARVVDTRHRPDFIVEPVAIAWDAVAFRIRGARDGIACVPRAELEDFLDRLDAGEYDATIGSFLATPSEGRVLRSAAQATTTGLFDSLAASAAIVPSERESGAVRLFGRAGDPVDARRHKGRGRLPRKVLVVVAAAALLLIAGVAVAESSGGSAKHSVVAPVTTTTRPTTSTTRPTTTTTIRKARTTIADALEGSWDVTRTITASTNAIQPVGTVSKVKYKITENCAVTPCTLHLTAPGDLGAVEESDLKLVTDHYEGAITGTTPCGRGLAPITGSVTLSPVKGDTDKFTGVLKVEIQQTDSCAAGRTGTLDLAGQRTP